MRYANMVIRFFPSLLPALILAALVHSPAHLRGQTRLELAAESAALGAPRAGESRGSIGSVLRGPVLGFLFEPRMAGLAMIRGVPGAAKLGKFTSNVPRLSAAAISPQQDFILAARESDGSVFLILIMAGRPQLEPLEGLPPGVERISLSPDGSAAVFYSRARELLAVASGLPHDPSVIRTLPTAGLTGAVSAAGVDDSGGVLLLATRRGGSGVLWSSRNGGNWQEVYSGGTISSVAFFRREDRAVAADARLNKVVLVSGLSGEASVQQLAGPGQLSHPVAVAISNTGNRIFAANAGSRSVLALSPDGAVAQLTPCGCLPTGLQPMKGENVFRLTDLSTGQVSLYDGSRSQPRVVAVPSALQVSPLAGDESPPVLRSRSRGGVR